MENHFPQKKLIQKPCKIDCWRVDRLHIRFLKKLTKRKDLSTEKERAQSEPLELWWDSHLFQEGRCYCMYRFMVQYYSMVGNGWKEHYHTLVWQWQIAPYTRILYIAECLWYIWTLVYLINGVFSDYPVGGWKSLTSTVGWRVYIWTEGSPLLHADSGDLLCSSQQSG